MFISGLKSAIQPDKLFFADDLKLFDFWLQSDDVLNRYIINNLPYRGFEYFIITNNPLIIFYLILLVYDMCWVLLFAIANLFQWQCSLNVLFCFNKNRTRIKLPNMVSLSCIHQNILEYLPFITVINRYANKRIMSTSERSTMNWLAHKTENLSAVQR